MEDKVALVTGASSGIGYATVTALLEKGFRVVGCARRFDKISEGKKEEDKTKLYPYKCDLRKVEEIRKMFEWIKEHEELGGKLDVCVINAGLTGGSNLMEGDVEEWRNMLDVNVTAVCLCAQLALKAMLSSPQKSGSLIFVNSISGHQMHPSPLTRFYCATKFAMTALVEGWRQEIREAGDNNNIRISSVSPRTVRTAFPKHFFANETDPELAAADLMESLPCLEPEDVAEAIMFIIEAPKHVLVHDVKLSNVKKSF